jgi:hypothetical protein
MGESMERIIGVFGEVMNIRIERDGVLYRVVYTYLHRQVHAQKRHYHLHKINSSEMLLPPVPHPTVFHIRGQGCPFSHQFPDLATYCMWVGIRDKGKGLLP